MTKQTFLNNVECIVRTWHGSNGRWRAGRPDEADDTEVIPLALPPLPPPPVLTPLVAAGWWRPWWWWRWWLWINANASDEASKPDVLLAISSAPEDNPADCSLETDWRPSEAPPDVTFDEPTTTTCCCLLIGLLFSCCCCCCCCCASGVCDDDDVNKDKDKSSGLSAIIDEYYYYYNQMWQKRLIFLFISPCKMSPIVRRKRDERNERTAGKPP